MNKPKRCIKVGVIGTGVMGRNHVRVATTNPKIECIGVFDPNETVGMSVAGQFGCRYFNNVNEMFEQIEAVIIASPTSTHFELAKQAIQAGLHCLIEKPITVEVSEGEELVQLAMQANVTLQIGHVERYNPVYPELKKILEGEEILAVKANRLSYNPSRATDVDVVLDLMIHDIDSVNSLLGGNLTVLGSSAGTFLSKVSDYATAILRGPNNIVVDLTASKISQTKCRTLTISCSESFISVDYLRKEIQINRRAAGTYVSNNTDIRYRQESLVEGVFVPNIEPLMAEHNDFAESIFEGREPNVTGYDGVAALKLAKEIQRQCNAN